MISDSPESPKRWQSTILPDKPRQAQTVVWALGKLKTIREAVSTVSEFLKCWSRPGEIYSPVKRGGAPKQLNQRQNLTFPAFRWPLSLCISTQGWVHQRPSSHSKRSGPSWNIASIDLQDSWPGQCLLAPRQACLTSAQWDSSRLHVCPTTSVSSSLLLYDWLEENLPPHARGWLRNGHMTHG